MDKPFGSGYGVLSWGSGHRNHRPEHGDAIMDRLGSLTPPQQHPEKWLFEGHTSGSTFGDAFRSATVTGVFSQDLRQYLAGSRRADGWQQFYRSFQQRPDRKNR